MIRNSTVMMKFYLLFLFFIKVCLLPAQQVPHNIDSLFSNGIISMDEYAFYMNRPTRNRLDSIDTRLLDKVKSYNDAILDKEQALINELAIILKNEEYIFVRNLTDSLMKTGYLNYSILSFLLDNIDLSKNNYQLISIDFYGSYPIYNSLLSNHFEKIMEFLLSSNYLDKILRNKQIELLKSFFNGNITSESNLKIITIYRKGDDWSTMKLSNLSKIITEK